MRTVAVLVVAAALTAACSGGAAAPAASPPAPAPAPTALPVSHPTVWLCRPGMPANPCEGHLDATVVAPGGGRSTERFRPAADPPVDCFYVYPTVSTAPGRNAPLRAGAAEIATARAQVARFASVCRVFAPVYRQVTVHGLATGGLTDRATRALAHGDVVDAWHDYLNRNPTRRFVLVGHSQGTFELTQLIQEEIDDDPALRSRLVSALLIGGYVSVDPATGTGDLRNIPACRRPGQRSCVVAYNSYAGTPPPNSVFGRTGNGRQILCTNPAALAGGPAPLHPYVPAARGFTAYPGAITGECRHQDGVSWLQVTGPPALTRLPGLAPTWGLHRGDVNLALGDLIALVRAQL